MGCNTDIKQEEKANSPNSFIDAECTQRACSCAAMQPLLYVMCPISKFGTYLLELLFLLIATDPFEKCFNVHENIEFRLLHII